MVRQGSYNVRKHYGFSQQINLMKTLIYLMIKILIQLMLILMVKYHLIIFMNHLIIIFDLN